MFLWIEVLGCRALGSESWFGRVSACVCCLKITSSSILRAFLLHVGVCAVLSSGKCILGVSHREKGSVQISGLTLCTRLSYFYNLDYL